MEGDNVKEVSDSELMKVSEPISESVSLSNENKNGSSGSEGSEGYVKC